MRASVAACERELPRPAPGTVPADRATWRGGRFSARARCILADNPSPLTYVGTNTWVLSEPGCTGCVVVDPGPALPAHLDAVHAACEEGGLRVAAVVLTHDHYDHAEGAQQFARRAKAPLLGRRAQTLSEGPLDLGADAPALEAVFLPGHSKDSIGLVFPKDGSVVTGDHVFRQSSTLICWPDGTLSDYLASLERLRRIVRTRRIRVLLTAHGLPIDDPLGLIDRQTAHRLSRLDRVRKIVAAGAGFDVDRILETVYDDVDARLNPAARVNVQAQIAYLQEEAASSTRI